MSQVDCKSGRNGPKFSDEWPSSMRSQSSQSSSTDVKSRNLRGNLTRTHKDRNPFDRYQVLQILGEGSMGNVKKVRKHPHAVGYSARTNLPARAAEEKKWQNCFQIPLIGGLLEFFFGDHAKSMVEKASRTPSEHLGNSSLTIATAASTNSSQDKRSFPTDTAALAMKSIHLKYIKDPRFIEELENEIAVLKTLDHPYIVKVMETYHFDTQLFVVMELCSGGDLYTRDPYTEEQAARLVTSILSAVAFMHSRSVIHRDLKYENILFVNTSPQAEIKLIDFGLSKEIKEHEKITEGAGTIYTMAPEVLKGNYNKEADLWSVGVIAYMLMSSQMPFFGKSRRELADVILSGTYEFKGRRWKGISSQGKEFVKDLLVLDPADRATADEAIRASWLNRRHTATARTPHEGELENVKRSIERYVGYPKLRKLSLMIVAHHSTSDEIGILRKVFQHYDKDGNGDLNYDEFKSALLDAGFSDDDFRKLFDAMDVDGTGAVHYTEFLAATMEAAGWISETRLAEAFDRVDHEDTGYITKENLQYLLGDDIPAEDIETIMKEAAPNNPKGISYEAFMAQWNDDKEEFEREWRKHMLPGTVNDPRETDETFDSVSELSFDGSDSNEPGRAKFAERKVLSERKLAKLTTESKVPVVREEE